MLLRGKSYIRLLSFDVRLYFFVFSLSAPCFALAGEVDEESIEIFKIERGNDGDNCNYFKENLNKLSCKNKFYIKNKNMKQSQVFIVVSHTYRNGYGDIGCAVRRCPSNMGSDFSFLDPYGIFRDRKELYVVKRKNR